MLSPFHIAVALGPLAIYLLVVAMVRLMPKPLVVSGGRDIATMSMALIGFAMVGPMELFFPKAAAMVLGPKVWIMLFLLYVLGVLMVILAAKPRLIVYGLDEEELEEHLRALLAELDPQAEWLGENVQSGVLGISALVESAGPGRLSQIAAISHRQNLKGWFALEQALVMRLRGHSVADRVHGWKYLVVGALLLVVVLSAMMYDPNESLRAMKEMLRI